METYITVGDAVELTGFTADWIRKLCRHKVVKCKKFGNAWMVEKESLQSYLEQERKPGPKSFDINAEIPNTSNHSQADETHKES